MENLEIEYNTLISTKGTYKIYYVEDDLKYDLVVVTPDFVNISTLYKNIDVDDISDFETNHKEAAVSCPSIDDAIAKGYSDLNI